MDPTVEIPRSTRYYQASKQRNPGRGIEETSGATSAQALSSPTVDDISESESSSGVTKDYSDIDLEVDSNQLVEDTISHSIVDDYDGDELHSDPGTFSSESDASFAFDSTDSDSSEESTIPDSARAFPFVENKTSHDESKGKCQAVLAYITRHHLSTAASEDLMSLMKLLQVDTLQDLSLFNLKTSAVPIEPVIYDICKVCSTLFPLDEDVIHCQRLGCTGKRYKGASSKHGMRQRISYFACLPLQEQLNDILSAPGVFESKEKYRNQCEKEDGLTDILNGSLNQELRKPGNFLSHPSNFSLIFNTDGVPLYSSSGVSIWPVYLVINELPLKQRF